MSHNILWLAPPNMSGGLKRKAEMYMRDAGISLMHVRMITPTTGMWKKRTKTIWHADPDRKPEFFARLQRVPFVPAAILINDRAALEYISGRFNSLAMCRGSVYELTYQPECQPGPATVPCIVIDDVLKLHKQDSAGFCLFLDLQKAQRWASGKQRPEPCFQHQVITTGKEAIQFEWLAKQAKLIAMDVETTGTGPRSCITCDGYSLWMPDGRILSYVIPWVDPTKPGGKYWQDPDEEAYIHEILQRVNALPVPKTLQNGQYDMHYYLRYRRPPTNWLFDTAVAWHSVWPEIPKRIDFIASIAVDHYRYWKEEHKEDTKADTKGGVKVPQTETGLEAYWRYNALDCHYTLLCHAFIFNMLAKPPMAWALENYRVSMRQVLGPGIAMSTIGVSVNTELQRQYDARLREAAATGLRNIRQMTHDNEFNPNSNDQVQQLLYDVWQCQPLTRGKYKGRSASEVALKIMQTQSPIVSRIIEAIWDAKKPNNNISKYGVMQWVDNRRKGLHLWNNRWYYTQNPIGTETGRYSSSQSNWWVGTQIQNPPYDIRNMVDADEGYWLFDADYSQSDGYYTAHQSGEEAMIEAMLSDRDTHCHHAAQFFQRDYDELLRGYLADDPAITESTTGVRQITKRVVYGANYLMAAYTLFLTMGKPAVVAAAKALGHSDADGWSLTQLVALCQRFLDFYFGKMYPGLLPWLKQDSLRVRQNGNRAVCAFGRTRTFFGDISETNSAAQRELAAFYGQGGTAGCVNLALDRLYWQSSFYANGGQLLFQMHDSIVGQVPVGRFDLLDVVLDCMSNECELRGRTFTVPVGMKVGFGWGKRMVGYTPGQTTAELIAEADAKWHGKWEAAA